MTRNIYNLILCQEKLRCVTLGVLGGHFGAELNDHFCSETKKTGQGSDYWTFNMMNMSSVHSLSGYSIEPQSAEALLACGGGWLQVLQHCARMLGSWQRPSQRRVWQKRLVRRSRTQTGPGGRQGFHVKATHRTITGTLWGVGLLVMWSCDEAHTAATHSPH